MSGDQDPSVWEDRLVAVFLRRNPDIAEGFFASPEWREMPEDLRERLYAADAEVDAAERRRYVAERQRQAEEAARSRDDGEEERGR